MQPISSGLSLDDCITKFQYLKQKKDYSIMRDKAGWGIVKEKFPQTVEAKKDLAMNLYKDLDYLHEGTATSFKIQMLFGEELSNEIDKLHETEKNLYHSLLEMPNHENVALSLRKDSFINPSIRDTVLILLSQEQGVSEIVTDHIKQYGIENQDDKMRMAGYALKLDPLHTVPRLLDFELDQDNLIKVLEKALDDKNATEQLARNPAVLRELNQLARFEFLKEIAADHPVLLSGYLEDFELPLDLKSEIVKICNAKAK